MASYITEKDCYSVMERRLKGISFQVTSFELKPFSDILGFHGSHALLKINAETGGKEKQYVFFVKLATKNQEIFDEYYAPMRLFFKEHIVMTKVLKELQAQVDKKLTSTCYLSRLDKFVVLENLVEAGYEVSKIPEMDFEHAKVAIEAFADFHAASFILEEKGLPISEKYPEILFESLLGAIPNRENYLTNSCDKGCRGVADKYLTKYPKNLRDEVFSKVKERLENLTKPSKKYRNVLCQGDPWGNNVLYKYADGHPKEGILVDFQAARYAPPALEFQQFIYIATEKDFREKHSKSIEDLYYRRLGATLAEKGLDVTTLLPRDVFRETCSVYREFGLCSRLYYVYVTRVPGEQLQQAAESAQVFLGLMSTGDPTLSLSGCSTSPQYRAHLIEAMEAVFQFYTGNQEASS